MKNAPYMDKEHLSSLIALGMTASEIGKQYGVHRGTIDYWCSKFSLTIYKQHGQKRIYTFDETFFTCIDSEEKAYILGFIMADGFIESSGRALTITLNKRDADLLEKIKQCLKANIPLAIKGKEKQFRALTFCSKRIVADLAHFSIARNKTKTLKFPDLASRLYSHFLRGYFDGDGHIGYRQCALTVGSASFLEGLLNFLWESHGFRPWIGNRTTYYHLQFNKKQSPFINWLYADARIYLARKYERFDTYWRSEHEAVELEDKEPLG
jgi:hypothetical protein